MILAIRDKFGSRLLDFFIWLSIIVFVGLYLIPSDKVKKPNQEWVVSVNNKTASYGEYLQLLENLRKLDQKNSSAANKEVNKKEVIKALTESLLLQSLAEKLNIEISDRDVNLKMQKLLPGMVQADGTIDFEQVKLRFMQENLGQAELNEFMANLVLIRKQISESLQNEIINHLLTGSLYLPDFIISNHYNALFADKKFTVLTASYQKNYDQINKQKIEDSALKAFFDQQNLEFKKYWTTETRSGEVWSFKPSDFGITVTDKQIKAYYDANRKTEFVKKPAQVQVRRILLGSEEQAGKIRADLANQTADFQALAKTHSLDKKSANQGGLIDFFGEDEKDRSFSQAAFELRVDGEISEVVKTSDGFEIIQRVAKKPAEFKSLEEVKTSIEKKIIEQQFAKLFPINARRAVAESAKNQQAFTNFVTNKKGIKKSLKSVVNKPQDAVLNKLFELKKADQKAYLLQDNLGEVVVLSEIIPSQVLNFEKVKASVLQDYKKHLATQALEKQINDAKASLQSGKSAQEVAQALGLEYTKTDFVNKQQLSNKHLPLDLLWSLPAAGVIKAKIVEQNQVVNGYVVRLDQIQKPTLADLNAKKSQIKASLFTVYRQGLDRSFVDYLHKNGTIEVNTAIINV